MKLLRIISYLSFTGLLFLLSCNRTKNTENLSGEELAKIHCASCHLFPEPELSDKSTWTAHILPVMGEQLGLLIQDGVAYPDIQQERKGDSTYFVNKSAISVEDWEKIVKYYIDKSPQQLPSQDRPKITAITDLFEVKAVPVQKDGFPALTYIKIDEGNQQIYAASTFDGSLNIFDKKLQEVSSKQLNATIVDIDFTEGLEKAGVRKGFMTNIGIMNPNDLKTGKILNFDASTKYASIIDSLQRPVQSITVDLDNDGHQDQLICSFGNKKGALVWYKNLSGKGYKKNIIRELPGAIKAYIEDVNKDGLPDIWVLFAQAQEGIFLFTNQGKGNFDTKEVLRFPSIYGSSYFEMTDLNGDGYKDILYVSGDNADYSSHLLKNYHGIYAYLNNGQNVFKQQFFFPIHGCYKATARDFDKDGDMDIAAISYFPDRKLQTQESFVYLQNQGKLNFKPFSIKQANAGKWLVMDTGDIDGDGDDDIVIGSLDLNKKGIKDVARKDTAFMLLENKKFNR